MEYLNDTIRIEGYEITKITDNSYSFESPDTASSTVSSGGGTLNIKYLIGNAESVGIESSDPALGWGTGAWGDSTWGTARTTATSDVSLEANTKWSLQIWGDDLLANNRLGQIYYWDTSGGENQRASSLFQVLQCASGVPNAK